jgi:hypothetical protein
MFTVMLPLATASGDAPMAAATTESTKSSSL